MRRAVTMAQACCVAVTALVMACSDDSGGASVAAPTVDEPFECSGATVRSTGRWVRHARIEWTSCHGVSGLDYVVEVDGRRVRTVKGTSVTLTSLPAQGEMQVVITAVRGASRVEMGRLALPPTHGLGADPAAATRVAGDPTRDEGALP